MLSVNINKIIKEQKRWNKIDPIIPRHIDINELQGDRIDYTATVYIV